MRKVVVGDEEKMSGDIIMFIEGTIGCILIILSIGLFGIALGDVKQFNGLDAYDQSRGGMGIIWWGMFETAIGLGFGALGVVLIWDVLVRLGL